MTARFDRFIEELEALCVKHAVQLCTSGYDGLEVWPLDGGEPPTYSAGVHDMTDWKERAAAHQAESEAREMNEVIDAYGKVPVVKGDGECR